MGSNPTPRTKSEPTELVNFGFWLIKRGNRESTVKRKLKYLKALNGSPQEMLNQVLASKWVDKSKSNAIDVVCQYAEFQGLSVTRPNFRMYDNEKGEYLGVQTMEKWDDGKGGRVSGNYPFTINDYLLITKGPSHKAGRKKGVYHINFGGLHGVGTRATGNFLRNTKWLNDASKEITESEYYQILLPIRRVDHDGIIRESTPDVFGEPIVHILSDKEPRAP